jgi:hypothetical protein
MISEIIDFLLPVTKNTADCHHQHEPWRLSTNKKTPKQTNNLRFRILLDNYFVPLRYSSNPFMPILSSAFPTIMPTKIPANQATPSITKQ